MTKKKIGEIKIDLFDDNSWSVQNKSPYKHMLREVKKPFTPKRFDSSWINPDGKVTAKLEPEGMSLGSFLTLQIDQTSRSIYEWKIEKKLLDMIIYAFRYCVGRNTAATDDCVNYLILHWKDLPDYARRLIEKEIREEFTRMATPVAAWMKILDLED